MKTIRFFLPVFLFLIFITACNKKDQEFDSQPDNRCANGNLEFASRPLKIAVLSDLHYMEPSLLRDRWHCLSDVPYAGSETACRKRSNTETDH